ncbi:MAG: endonuclease/exonuclease/phosphatase family protein [Porphyromonadaceae bacterium]|nr:endonuclease/exonuclease/phosphatase family protein [Porphyromonadaceae bacterium]
MFKNLYLVSVLLLFVACGTGKKAAGELVSVKAVSVGFYNLENLFDTIKGDNLDDEYLPNGPMRWTSMKYKSKLKNMAYAISQIGLETTPKGVSILGVCEIENKSVLEDLVKEPAIANRTYNIVHYDSPDRRGVDVGLLYDPRDFIVTSSKSYRLNMPGDTLFLTRDQLLVSGYLLNEKIHVIVGHWPSRWGGETASSPRREAAAALSKHIADSIYRQEPKAKIIIMGDFNDDPANVSVAKVLDAKRNREDVPKQGLYNPMWRIHDSGVGSLAYNNQWNLFDQIIISEPFLHNDNSHLRFWKAEVFNKSFLIQQEGAYKGTPLRTHAGGVWLNGYSDHFPTLIYLVKE